MKTGRILFATSLGVLAIVGLCGAQSSDEVKTRPKASTCLSSSNMDTTILDKDTILARSMDGRGMLIHVKGCGLTSFDPLVFTFRGSNTICDRMDVEVGQLSQGFKRQCFVQSVETLTAEEAKGLENRRR